MKIVRRDHSISPTDRSKTRSADGRKPGALERRLVPSSFHQVLEDRLQVVVGEVTSSIVPNSPLAAISVTRA
jgi:hypothetical protein